MFSFTPESAATAKTAAQWIAICFAVITAVSTFVAWRADEFLSREQDSTNAELRLKAAEGMKSAALAHERASHADEKAAGANERAAAANERSRTLEVTAEGLRLRLAQVVQSMQPRRLSHNVLIKLSKAYADAHDPVLFASVSNDQETYSLAQQIARAFDAVGLLKQRFIPTFMSNLPRAGLSIAGPDQPRRKLAAALTAAGLTFNDQGPASDAGKGLVLLVGSKEPFTAGR